jgi:hypothetical protein
MKDITNIGDDEKTPAGRTRVWAHAIEVTDDLGMFRHEVYLFPDLMGFRVQIWPLNASGWHDWSAHISRSSDWLHGPEADNKLGYDIWALMSLGDPAIKSDQSSNS